MFHLFRLLKLEVSNVVGQLRDDQTVFDAFRSVFPAGTVSGAPKIRAMQIIGDLEPCSRGPYAGAVGYFSYDGSLDTAIMIRTVFCENSKATLQAGAGIVIAFTNHFLELLLL